LRGAMGAFAVQNEPQKGATKFSREAHTIVSVR
jgi:hypothetical protein